MAKNKKYEDPYRKVRRGIPPPEFAIPHDKEYNRSKSKNRIKNIIESGMEEYEEDIYLSDFK